MNTISIIGTLTADVELRYTAGGSAVGNFAIAHNKKFTKNGKIVEAVSYFDVSCFGKTAEVINQFFRKGSRIAITGELEQQRWETQDGQKRSKVVIRLEKFDFIDKKEQQGGQQQGGYRQPDPQYQRPQQPQQQPHDNYEDDAPPF